MSKDLCHSTKKKHFELKIGEFLCGRLYLKNKRNKCREPKQRSCVKKDLHDPTILKRGVVFQRPTQFLTRVNFFT